jgi:hypothetical protein
LLRNSPGSFATLVAILRASSFVRSFADERRPGFEVANLLPSTVLHYKARA